MTENTPEVVRFDTQLVNRDELDGDEQKAYEAYKLQIAGHDWTTIALQVGYKTAQTAEVCVRQLVQQAALDLAAERRQELLQLQLDRINTLISAQWPLAMSGDTRAADFCLKAIAQSGRFLGLEQLHEKSGGSSTKTIVIAGSSEEYSAALRRFVEE